MDLKDIRLYVDDRPAEGVFRVHRDVYSDPELFELEQKFIFERTWNFLALESQIPGPNDFVTGHIARTPVLATRDARGRIGAFVNVCRHKGAMLCALVRLRGPQPRAARTRGELQGFRVRQLVSRGSAARGVSR